MFHALVDALDMVKQLMNPERARHQYVVLVLPRNSLCRCAACGLWIRARLRREIRKNMQLPRGLFQPTLNEAGGYTLRP